MIRRITIAIDGHSSTGKSTLAKQLADALGYVYVDSGAMYRCVTFYAIQKGYYAPALDVPRLISNLENINIEFVFNPASGKNHPYLNGEDVEEKIRGMEVSNKVSEVAALTEVRKRLVALQQEMGTNQGVVMDGRDIGTVVFPNAEVKIFMTASAQVRAQRRFDELKAKGQSVNFEEVLHNVVQRDEVDSNRADSPLVMAEDARLIDNSTLSREAQFNMAIGWAKEIIGAW
jgi:cytidylate kinase